MTEVCSLKINWLLKLQKQFNQAASDSLFSFIVLINFNESDGLYKT